MDGPNSVYLRYRGSLKRVAVENVRLATDEELLGSTAVREALQALEAELTGKRRPFFDEVPAAESGATWTASTRRSPSQNRWARGICLGPTLGRTRAAVRVLPPCPPCDRHLSPRSMRAKSRMTMPRMSCTQI
jgi:hypothetical protein